MTNTLCTKNFVDATRPFISETSPGAKRALNFSNCMRGKTVTSEHTNKDDGRAVTVHVAYVMRSHSN